METGKWKEKSLVRFLLHNLRARQIYGQIRTDSMRLDRSVTGGFFTLTLLEYQRVKEIGKKMRISKGTALSKMSIISLLAPFLMFKIIETVFECVPK